MQTLRTTLAAVSLALAAASAAHAAGVVEVSFTNPEKYVDAGRSVVDREKTVDSLRRHFEQLGKRLPDGQTLKIEVLDVDLAGEMRPNARGNDLRVLNGRADWPRIELKYTLQAPSQAERSGIEKLTDMNYMQSGPRNDSRELAYERRMIDRWFEQTFIKPKAAVAKTK